MSHFLPDEEEDALRRILRHNDVSLKPALLSQLGQLIMWVHQLEQAKASFSQENKPPPMLSLLSLLGIYGGEAIGPMPKENND